VHTQFQVSISLAYLSKINSSEAVYTITIDFVGTPKKLIVLKLCMHFSRYIASSGFACAILVGLPILKEATYMLVYILCDPSEYCIHATAVPP